MKFFKKNSILFVLIIALSSSFFYAQEKTGEYYISLFSGDNSRFKLKEYKGPFETVEQVLANWIYEDLPENTKYAITKNNSTLVTRTPQTYFPNQYVAVENDFLKDRHEAMNKYEIVPIEKVDKKYQKKSKYFLKKLHPREYVFDINAITNEIFLKYENKESFTAIVDFTPLCLNDLPRKGDKVTIYYNFKTTNQIKDLKIQLYGEDPKKGWIFLGEQTIIDSLAKKQTHKGSITFSLSDNSKSKCFIKVINNQEDKPFHIDQTFLKFRKVVDSTNTIKEAQEESKAERKNIKIIEASNTVIEEELRLAEEERIRAEMELQAQLEEEKRLEEERILREQQEAEAERLRIEQEKLEQEEFLRKLEEATSGTAKRYKKEYLQDYETDEFSVPKKEKKNSSSFIGDPNETDATSKSLLMKAAKSGNDWQIKNLINAGADVNYKDKDGWTALMYAVRYQENLNAITLLLQAGADIQVENNFRTTALTIATCYNTNPDILNELLKYYEPSNKDVLKSLTMLFVSSQPSEFIQIAKLNTFLNKGVPINTFYEGKTPLMYACQYGNSTNVIQLLLDNKAAVTIRSSEGKTAFDYASKNTNLQHDDTYWSLNRKKQQ